MSRTSRLAITVLACLAPGVATGCAGRPFATHQVDFDYAALPPAAPAAAAEGAIWRGARPSGSFLFYDIKARGLGDLVTVIVDENISAAGHATTDLDRSSEIGAGVSSDVGLADILSKGFRKLAELFGIDGLSGPTQGANVSVLESTTENSFEGDGSTTRSGRFTAMITCRVVNVLPGNVFHIRGQRSLHVNHEEQLLTLEALVRQEDIRTDNSVHSAVLAEARMRLDGIGVIDDKQLPGWFARVMDWVYPF